MTTTGFDSPSGHLRAVVCGSYRRAPGELRNDYMALRERFDVLSPISLDFVNPGAEFVRLASEVHELPTRIEERHLQALSEADFVWLHAPEGYVGVSAMYEIGYAHALGIPVFSRHQPREEAFRESVLVVDSPQAVNLQQAMSAPGNGLRGLQRYYERTAARRGWASESIPDTMLLLTEEIGELARALRKSAGISRDHEWEGQDVAGELADVQLYLVHLANISGIELADAVTRKEVVNASRAIRTSDTA